MSKSKDGDHPQDARFGSLATGRSDAAAGDSQSPPSVGAEEHGLGDFLQELSLEEIKQAKAKASALELLRGGGAGNAKPPITPIIPAFKDLPPVLSPISLKGTPPVMVTPAPPPAIEAVVREELARRKPLFDTALEMMAPIMDLLRSARAQGADLSLEMTPPLSRGDGLIYGQLRCRSFHEGVGSEECEYTISISPLEGWCKLELPNSASEEEQREYFDYHNVWLDTEWEETYWRPDPAAKLGRVKGPSMADLHRQLEEALITQLVEHLGGLRKIVL